MWNRSFQSRGLGFTSYSEFTSFYSYLKNTEKKLPESPVGLEYSHQFRHPQQRKPPLDYHCLAYHHLCHRHLIQKSNKRKST